jgi:hypothetical protein
MTPIADVGEVDVALSALGVHARGPFVVRLPRAPGARDARHAHLLCGDIDGALPVADPEEATAPAAAPHAGLAGRVERLETEVESLKQALTEIRSRL